MFLEFEKEIDSLMFLENCGVVEMNMCISIISTFIKIPEIRKKSLLNTLTRASMPCQKVCNSHHVVNVYKSNRSGVKHFLYHIHLLGFA